jgi:MFS family permease
MTSKQKWILVLAAMAAFMTALDTLVVTTALSTIRSDLGASVEGLEWTVNAYNLSFAVLLMTAAALGDRFGRRRLFASGIALFALASAACALAPSIGALIAARAVQGAGAAVAGGPLVGGAVTQGIAWEWIFWLNVPIGLLLIPLVLRRIPESPDSKVDLPGLALVSAGVLGVVWALVRGNASGWASPGVLGSLLGGLALLGTFAARRAAHRGADAADAVLRLARFLGR